MEGTGRYHCGGRNIHPSRVDGPGRYIFESQSEYNRTFPNDLKVESVKNSADFKIFYTIPYQVYRDNPFWIAPFRYEMNGFFKKKNPFWSHATCQLFIARKNQTVVGRIAAIIDYSYCESNNENIGFFGFFECIEDYTCAHALLITAQEWLRKKQMTKMRGPIDGRIDVGCGFLYTGFESPPSLLSTYTPSYYVSYAERFGLKKCRDLILYRIDLTKPLPKSLEEKAQQSAASGIHIRTFNRFRTGKELTWWVDFFLETFSDHWGYVPVSPGEVKTRFGIKELRWFLDSSLFLIAEYKDRPVAYLWSTPDYNQVFKQMHGRLGVIEILRFLSTKRKINSGKLHFIGIKKEYRNQNIGSYLNYAALVEMKRRGYMTAEVGWIDEQNTVAHTTIAITGANIYKKHRVFEKELITSTGDDTSGENED